MFLSLLAGFAFQFPLSTVPAEKSPDEILVGVLRNFPPEYSIDEKTGKPTGFAIDIMDEVSRKTGLKIRYVIFDEWPPIIQALKEGRIDIIPDVGIIEIEERKKEMDFTRPVGAFNIGIFVCETTTDIHGIDDLRGRKIAVVRDNKGLFIIQAYGRARPFIFNSIDEALLSLLSGNTDALVYTESPVLLIAGKSKLSERIKMVGEPLLEVKRAIAVGKGKTDLLNKLDAAVKALIATREYKKIYARWYSAPEPYWDVRRVLIVAGIMLGLVIAIFTAGHFISLMRLNRDLKYALEEREKAEELFKAITSSTPDHIIVQDSDLRYSFVMNPQLGLTERDMLGKTDHDFLSEADADKLTAIKRQVLKTGRPAHVETPLTTSTGEQHFFDGSYIPKFDAKGQVDGLIGYFRNITERKRADTAIQEGQERVHRQRNAIAKIAVDDAIAFGDVPVAMCRLTELISGVMQVERASVWLLSETREELRCIALFEASAKRRSEGVVLRAAEYPRYFEAMAAESRINASDVRTDRRTSEFTEGYLVPLGITSMLDAGIMLEGKLAGVVCIEHTGEKREWKPDEEAFAGTMASLAAQIFTNAKRKRAEEAIRIANAYNRNLIEVSLDPLVTIGKDGKITDVNAATEAVTGFTRAELIGSDFSSYFSAPEKARQGYEQVFRSGFVRDYPLDIKHREGRITPVLYNALVYKTEAGNVIGVFAAARDITDRKVAEEKLHASLREKEILIREMHHRVKNNMQVVSSLLDLQARSSENPRLFEMLNDSRSRIRSMAMVHEKLYDSKDLTRIDLAGYVRTLSNELCQAHKINPGQIDLIIQTDGDIYVDIHKAIPCGLVLNELISNTLKHAFPGEGPGELRIIIRETENNGIEIVVRDNGVGLPDDVDIHAPRAVGLYLVNGLVKNQLDGQLEVRRDVGTEFRIKFPL
ncbi:MAG: transporter substrate-binding domain-containing protein [Eubacteriales bacterium]|nr:transporter substrate-binding domain-containing protein [Eubacteriales bacterium]